VFSFGRNGVRLGRNPQPRTPSIRAAAIPSPLLIIMDKLGRIRLIHNGYDRSEPLKPELVKETFGAWQEGWVRVVVRAELLEGFWGLWRSIIINVYAAATSNL